MNNELIVFTHNDLDALGCMLNLEYRFPNVRKKYFHTNYANIIELTDEILEYQARVGNTHIVMPDVSFSDNKDSLRRIYETFPKCTHIDHHLYPEGFWDEFPNMKVVWDKTKSATKLCNEYLGNAGAAKGLDTLTYLIDVYDLWQTKSEHFEIAQDLNEYFWRNDTVNLLGPIMNNDFKLPKNYHYVIDEIHKEYEAAMASYEKRNLIHRAGEITVAFVQDWFNQILIKEMKNGQNFVIGVNPYGIVKVRIKEEAPYTDEQKDALRLELTGNTNIGHMNAFTYKVHEATSFDVIMKEIQKVTTAIERIMV